MILDYFRHGTMCDLSKLSITECQELANEVAFYGIASLQSKEELVAPQVYFLPKSCSNKLKLSQKNTRVTKMNTASNWQSNVLCNKVSQWRVKLIHACTSIMIGVAPSTLNVDEPAYNACGWYIFLKSATKYAQDGTHNLSTIFSNCNANGTVLDFVYEQGQLRMTCNGTSSTLYENLPLDLHPAFLVNDANSCIEVSHIP